ncbi:acyl-CoA N-acyltransferase [Flagelloscypha sp. PMI_526]|nr:acyl-CoA N-acyltransferase [Flagelloscypha sp. PMI_526]
MFTTKSLTLVAYDASKHSTIIYEADNNIEIMRYLTSSDIVPRTKEFCDKKTQGLIDKSSFNAVFQLTETGEVVGWARALGKGYAKEVVEWLLGYAFDNLGYHRMGLNVYGGNTRAIKLYEKIGFKEEGRIREALYCNGKWEDSIEMGMLKREWKAIKKALENI